MDLVFDDLMVRTADHVAPMERGGWVGSLLSPWRSSGALIAVRYRTVECGAEALCGRVVILYLGLRFAPSLY
ncbi:MAG: hypothetical protein JWM04_2600 [Verrucomicrobiales bacterium]|nr:hypothetical protein [Verrucomicrobiales bacterium]